MTRRLVFFIAAYLAAYIALGASPAVSRADDLSTVHDCSEVILTHDRDDTLTREERIMRMEQAFDESLTRFEACDVKGTGAAGTGGLSGDEASQGQSRGGNTAGMSSSDSAADPGGLSGDEPLKQEEADERLPDDIPSADTDDDTAARLRQKAEAEQDPEKQVRLWNEYRRYKGLPEWQPHGSGTPPSDIPPADNDDVVAAQIRQAAEAEQDPGKKAKLWNEYRRYKGLPEKSAEGTPPG